jgi:hypothetical protein
MRRHGTPEEMAVLSRQLQAEGSLSKGLPVSEGCVMSVVPYPLRVTLLKYSGLDDSHRFRSPTKEWLERLFMGTVTAVEHDFVTVRWDVGGGEQICLGKELVLIHQWIQHGQGEFQGQTRERIKAFKPSTEWWKQVTGDVTGSTS